MKEKYVIEVESFSGDRILYRNTDSFSEAMEIYKKESNKHPEALITLSKILLVKTRFSEEKYKN